ncbi:hypothetical protein JOC34_003027 [Virgibacillus halotolerans]|nr:hypothetical protein [Virgibacillus halotolerans]
MILRWIHPLEQQYSRCSWLPCSLAVCGGYLLDQFGWVPVLRVAAGIGIGGLALTIFSSSLTIGVIGVFYGA